MDDFLDFLKIIGTALGTIFVFIGIIVLILIWSNSYTCPKVAEIYDTEYKTIYGGCYLKSDNGEWLREDHFKTSKMINSLNVSESAKVLLIKNIEK